MATMMELPQEELERMQFFEQARVRAEQDHKAMQQHEPRGLRLELKRT